MDEKDLFKAPDTEALRAAKQRQDFYEMAMSLPELSDIIADAVIERYKVCRHDKTLTAESLGIGRATLYRKLDKLGIV
jgi:transcriptional regulator of acetoin/glycerol metabolism